MKLMPALIAFLFLSFTINWENDFAKAKQTAAAEHKYVLLNFSGSDWCGPCIRLHKEIFQSDAFTAMAAEHLVLVNADFPRQKKNQLSKTLQQQNDQLADKYNSTGSFPYTVLLTPEGKVVQAWEGYPKEGAAAFINALKQAIDAGK